MKVKKNQDNQANDQSKSSIDKVTKSESNNVADLVDISESTKVNTSTLETDDNHLVNDVEMSTVNETAKIDDGDKSQQQNEQMDIYKEDSDSDYPDEDIEENESSEAMQSNQSYWIFGDALTRFKTACKSIQLDSLNVDDEEFGLQLIVAKRSLKEILAVFLRMVIIYIG